MVQGLILQTNIQPFNFISKFKEKLSPLSAQVFRHYSPTKDQAVDCHHSMVSTGTLILNI